MPLPALPLPLVHATRHHPADLGLCDEVVLDALMEARAALRPAADAAGVKVTYLPLIIKATSLALSQHPHLNAHVAADASEVVEREWLAWEPLVAHTDAGTRVPLSLPRPARPHYSFLPPSGAAHNIGIAMDTPRGLIVPNVKGVERLTVLEVAAELARLQALAAEGRLGAADLSDGTFTLSNIGSIGGTYASPVLFAPEVAIGAIGTIRRLPRFASTLPGRGARRPDGAAAAAGDAIVAAHIMTISWAADHRVVEGAAMARFANTWKALLEAPLTMLGGMR